MWRDISRFEACLIESGQCSYVLIAIKMGEDLIAFHSQEAQSLVVIETFKWAVVPIRKHRVRLAALCKPSLPSKGLFEFIIAMTTRVKKMFLQQRCSLITYSSSLKASHYSFLLNTITYINTQCNFLRRLKLLKKLQWYTEQWLRVKQLIPNTMHQEHQRVNHGLASE
jgi:hypothetical protein